MENFWKLLVFQKTHKLVLEVYKITQLFPDYEKFGLISQMRRSAVSIAANIAEATKRKSAKDRINFHNISNGSLEELKYYFILSSDLGYIDREELNKLINISREIGAMITGLTRSLKT